MLRFLPLSAACGRPTGTAIMRYQDGSPAAADAWLFVCLAGVGGQFYMAIPGVFALVPPFLQDTPWLMAMVGLFGLALRAWEGHRAHSRSLLDRDTRIAELGIKVGGLQDSLGKCEVLLEVYKGLCGSADCPLRDKSAEKATA